MPLDRKYTEHMMFLREEALKRCLNRTEIAHDPRTYMRGQCQLWAQAFAIKFKELRLVKGFYSGVEHFWCVDLCGTIVDPSVGQFTGKLSLETNSENYREFDPLVDTIRLGTCPNCGDPIMGLESEGRDYCDEDCQSAYAAYVTNSAASFGR